MLTKEAPADSVGLVLGLNMAAHVTLRSLALPLGRYLVSTYGVVSLGVLGIGLNVLTLMSSFSP